MQLKQVLLSTGRLRVVTEVLIDKSPGWSAGAGGCLVGLGIELVLFVCYSLAFKYRCRL